MLQYRRIAVLALGVWMGAAIYADIAVTQNFQAVDRFLNEPGTAGASAQIRQIGRSAARTLLRRNAAEENNVLFENTERAELVLAAIVAFFIAFEPRPNNPALAMAAFAALIVLMQHFLLSPQIAGLGRTIDSLPPGDAAVSRFWTMHAIYSGAEILKLLVTFALGVRLCVRRPKEAAAHG